MRKRTTADHSFPFKGKVGMGMGQEMCIVRCLALHVQYPANKLLDPNCHETKSA